MIRLLYLYYEFYYLFTNETCDLIAAVIACFSAAFRCGSYCNFGYSYVLKIFQMILFSYGVSVLLQLQVFMEIAFSLDRIRALKVTSTQVSKGMKFRYKLAISVAISLIASGPNYLISRSITPVGILVPSNQTLYAISTSPIFASFFWSIGLSVFNILRGVVPMLFLSILNILLYHKFKKKKILQLTNVNLSENRDEFKKRMKEIDISRLVLAINSMYLIGYSPYFTQPLLELYLGENSQIFKNYFIVASFLLFFSHFFYIFIFYKLSPSYKKAFLKTFLSK